MPTIRRSPLVVSIVLAAFLAISFAIFVVVRSPRPSVTVQIDVAKAVALANEARTVDGRQHAAVSALTLTADIDSILGSAMETDEFRALPMAGRFTDDDSRHQQGIKALNTMCSWSVRADPPAVRVTVTASDLATADRVATLLAKALRDRAMDTAVSCLATRRGLERQILQTLESSSRDQHDTIDRMRALAAEASTTPPESASRALDEAAKRLAYCEVLERQLAGLEKRIESQRANTHVFDDLAAECNAAASFWTVPRQSLADAGWMKVNRLEPTDVAFALADPASGKDWLAGALSTRDRALTFAIDLPEVRATEWMKSRTKEPAARETDRARILAVARRELAACITLNPRGDGSIVAVGLSGGFSDDDRRTLMRALGQAFALDLAEKSSIEFVDRRERLDRRLSDLGTELRNIELDFLREAAGQPSGADVPALLESSELGRRLRQLMETCDELESRRSRLGVEASTLCQGIWIAKQAH